MPTSQRHHACKLCIILGLSIVSKSYPKLVYLTLNFLNLQADVETDEVYAQMTLQPLTPVIY